MAAKNTYQGMPKLGRYVLLREIARSNDVVWEATDPQMDRRVAVKELNLPRTLTGQARRERIERFYREARAAGAMAHPNIVTIYEVGEDDGRFFIAMEYLEGQTLRERLISDGSLPAGVAVNIAVELCNALEYAHGRGVIHRDIKPDNVHLLADGRIKLTDFGIARITHEDSLTLDGQVFGTPSYMSPEQVIGRAIDTRSDLFSIGILLYELLSGAKPFTGDSVVTITYRILHETLPSLPGAPPSLEAVLRQATAKDPAQRFGTAAEMRTALLNAAQQDGALSMPHSPAASPSSGQSTVLYSTRTQIGLPLDAATRNSASTYVPPPLTVPPPADVPAARSPARNLITVVLMVALVLGVVLGGAWLVNTAYHNFTSQSRQGAEEGRLNAAIQSFRAGKISEAATAFNRLRESRNTSVRAKAPLYESYSYRELANRYIEAGKRSPNDLSVQESNLALAEQMLSRAVEAAQAALARAPSDEAARKGYREAVEHLNEVKKRRGVSPESLTPRPVAPQMTPATTAPFPTPSSGSSPSAGSPPTPFSFQQQNAARAAEAARLLQTGNEAWRRGNRGEAVKFWSQAVEAGPGSPAALQAGDNITKFSAGNSF